jgi:phosphate starvation-inducible protein PhoH and related proteins
VESARQNDIVFAVGPAGTGKTYTAVALAVAALKSRQVKKLVVSRPAVEAGESLGFLPGDFREKIDPYLRPLYDALEDMLPRDKLFAYIDQNTIEIVPLAYMRGRTLSSAFVILDEAQNATAGQMKMFLTRLGPGSRAIITGDLTQTDLPKNANSGLAEAMRILESVDGIDFVPFDRADVVRHRLVKDIIEAYEQDEERQPGQAPPNGDGV